MSGTECGEVGMKGEVCHSETKARLILHPSKGRVLINGLLNEKALRI